MFTKAMIAASAAYLVRSVTADEYTGNGNTQMTVGSTSEAVVYYGDVSPWTVFDSLNDNCNDNTCNANAWTFPTDLGNTAAGDNSPTNVTPGTVTVTALDATFENDVDRQAIIYGLQVLANQTQISQTWTEYSCAADDTTEPAPSYKKRAMFDLALRDFCCNCPENGTPFQQYSSAGTWYMRINDDDGNLRSELRLSVQAGVNDDADSSTLCSDLATAGSAVAGAFTGGAAAAAGISLGGLFCGLVGS